MATDMTKVRMGFTPANSNGAMTTMPSGTFCMAMPKLTVQLVATTSLKLTPAAMPSGNLCKAMAMTNNRILLSDALWRCSSASSPVI